MRYGAAPEMWSVFEPDWDEYMHYMYLPVVLGAGGIKLPPALKFLEPLIIEVMNREGMNEVIRGYDPEYVGAPYKYVYVSARRGFATPGNPLNRPGWHSDGFGTDDVNYIWTDRYPTVFAIQEFTDISDDHVESVKQFEAQIWANRRNDTTITYPDKMVLRLTPAVVHAAPEIPEPGGERGFFKISFSNSQFNLKGNSHNYLIDYNWEMWDRSEVRNHPSYAGGDAGPS